MYDILETLIEHGHDKEKVLTEYSKEEALLFYEKCVKQDMRKQADFIEAVMVGAGALFGGGKKISKTLEKMRE